MQHALVTIEQNAPAEIHKTPQALNVGQINHGASLFKVYIAEETKESTQVQTILGMLHLTCDEFQTACKKAQELADETDKANGFKAADDAKGAEKYGPKRKVINQRLSEAKQIFGASKINPELCKEKGYWASCQASRDFLAEKGLKWDGSNIPSDAQKRQSKETKNNGAAMLQAMKDHPQQAGEDMAEYMTRLVPIAKETAFNNEVNNLVEKMLNSYGSGDAMLTAAMRIVEMLTDSTQKHDFAQHLHELALFMASK